MFDRMYYKNPYLFEFTAKVEDVIQEKDYYKLVLSDTIFYPEGGGQPADIGTIDDEEVFDVQEENDTVYHYVRKDFEIGKEVELKLDAINRIENMKGHTAEHIVSGTVCSKFGANNVGFHMGKDIITMDFDKVLTKEMVAEVERKANKVIYMNYQVIEDIVTPKEAERIEYRSKKELDGDIRLVSIPGIDVCACCGLHVERTGEIGIIKIMSFEKYKSGTRIFMISSRRALREFNFEQGILNELSQKYSVPFEEILDRMETQRKELEEANREIGKLRIKVFENDIKKLNDEMINVAKVSNVVMPELKDMIEILDKKHAMYSVILSDIEGSDEVKYIIKTKNELAKDLSSKLNDEFNGKGGGKANLSQGSLKGKIEDIEVYLKKVTSDKK